MLMVGILHCAAQVCMVFWVRSQESGEAGRHVSSRSVFRRGRTSAWLQLHLQHTGHVLSDAAFLAAGWSTC